MFKLIFVKDEQYFAIQDTTDFKIDIVTEPEIMKYLHVGLEIGGITPVFEQNTFSYTDEFFVPFEEDDDGESESSEDDDDAFYFDEEDEDLDFDIESEGYFEEEDDEEMYDAFDLASEEAEEAEFASEEDDMSLFDEYGDDYEDFGAEEEDTWTNKLYACLTPQQKDVLKRYYLWSSQILFNGAPTGGNLQIAAKKSAKLNALRSQGQDWVYAGFVDLEYHGAGHCNFGHALRYKHFAWDVNAAELNAEFWGQDCASINWERITELRESGHVIEFGLQCIADFFDVPKETLAVIRTMQRDALKEMEEMCKIYLAPETLANAKASFGVFELLADGVVREQATQRLMGGKDFKQTVDLQLLYFYGEFKKLGMLYPRSLVKRIQGYLFEHSTKWSYKCKNFTYLTDTVMAKNIKRIRGIKVPYINHVLNDTNTASAEFVRVYLQNLFLVQSGGIYAYNPHSLNPRDRDEGGKNKASRDNYRYITGVSDSDAEIIHAIMQNYESYPMCFNQIRVRRVQTKGQFDDIRFTPEYIMIVDKFQEAFDKYVQCGRAEIEKLELPYINKYVGKSCSSLGKWEFSEDSEEESVRMRSMSLTSIVDYWQEMGYDSEWLQRRMSVIKVGDDEGTLGKTLEEATATMNSKVQEFQVALEDFKTKIVDYLRNEVKEHNEKLEVEEREKEEKKKLKEEARKAEEQRLAEEEAKQKAEEDKAVAEDLRGTWERLIKTAEGGKTAIAGLSTEDVVACIKYADTQPELTEQLNSVNPVILQILTTLKRSKKEPSRSQLYHLRNGATALLQKYDKSGTVAPVETLVRTKVGSDVKYVEMMQGLTQGATQLKQQFDGKTFFRMVTAINRINKTGEFTNKDMDLLQPAIEFLNLA